MYVPTPPGLFTNALTLRISKYCDVDIAVRYQSCHHRQQHSVLTAERNQHSASALVACEINCVEDAGVIWTAAASPNPASCARYDFLCFLADICNVCYVDVTIGQMTPLTGFQITTF